MRAENQGNEGCLQRDSAEREGNAGARSIGKRETGEADGADMLERILDRENLNRAYKRVRANKGAARDRRHERGGAHEWLKEHGEELLESMRSGKYKLSPVRRKEIPKGDGGATSEDLTASSPTSAKEPAGARMIPSLAC